MKIPLFLAVAQWALLLALMLLVVIMYRQLARVFGRRQPATGHGPPAGSQAPAIEYLRLSDDMPGHFTPGRGPALVAFVEPSCAACDRLVAAIDTAAAAGDLAGLRVLLLMSDPPKYLQVSDSFLATRQEIGRILTRATVDAYQALATPLLVAIDAAGVVQSAGPAYQVADVRSYAQACLLPAPGQPLPLAGAGGGPGAAPAAGHVPSHAERRERHDAVETSGS